MITGMTASHQWVERDGHRALELPALGRRPAIRHLFGLRGPRPVEVLAKHFGVSDGQVASACQVHGDSVWVVDESERKGAVRDQGREYDALVTNCPGRVLTVRTADCVPILIWDARRKVVGAVHAGWRGTLKAVASKTVLMMQSRFGSRPRDLRVGIGPAAGPCCYEVDGPVLAPLRDRFDYWRAVVRENGKDKGMLDLPGLNLRQLADSGVPSDRVIVAGTCTVCHPEGFYSYRRDGTAAGGMISGIMICP